MWVGRRNLFVIDTESRAGEADKIELNQRI